MRIGISANSKGPEQAKEMIRSARNAGFQGIQFKTSQLRSWDFEPEALLAIDPAARDLARAGVVYHPGSDYAEWAEPTRRITDWIRTLGGEHVCYCFGPEPPAETAAEQLMKTGRGFAAAGAGFSFHNHAGTIVGTLDEIRRMRDLLDPTVCGLTFDTAHAAKCGIDDLASAARALASHITNVHLKDVDRDGAFCPLGAGELDLAPVVEALCEMDYSHWLIVDEESEGYEITQACDLSAGFLRKHGALS